MDVKGIRDNLYKLEEEKVPVLAMFICKDLLQQIEKFKGIEKYKESDKQKKIDNAIMKIMKLLELLGEHASERANKVSLSKCEIYSNLIHDVQESIKTIIN